MLGEERVGQQETTRPSSQGDTPFDYFFKHLTGHQVDHAWLRWPEWKQEGRVEGFALVQIRNSGECGESVCQSLRHVWLFATAWTVAHQAPLFMGFSRQEYWSVQPFPSPRDLPNPEIKSRSPALQVDSLPSGPPGKPNRGQQTMACGLLILQIKFYWNIDTVMFTYYLRLLLGPRQIDFIVTRWHRKQN